jgi:hypothetical protein
MEDEKQLNKIMNEYYELKAKYDQKLLNERTRIRKNKVTKDEKISEYRKFKFRCIKCGKEGKMNFKRYNNQLKVSCPNEESPCDLLININLNIVDNYYLYYNKLVKKIEGIKEQIIRKKLDLLYDLEEDDVVLQEFERIKSDFLDAKNEMKKIQEDFDSKLKFDYQNDESGELEKKYIRDEVDKLQKEANNNIAEFNEKLKKEGLSGDIMSFYITDILEKQNQIRQLKYYNGFQVIETKPIGPRGKETLYTIYSKQISYKNQEIVKEKGKVIDYMKPKPKEEEPDEEIMWSPTEPGDGQVKVPKPLTIKIPTETTETFDGPTSPDYSPTTPTTGFSAPTTPDYSPTTPTDTIQEVNLDDLKIEK